MDEQENNEQVAIEPEKKRRGRPAKTLQSGITVVNAPKEFEESIIEDGKKIKDDDIAEEPKKKRGRKPKKDILRGVYLSDHKIDPTLRDKKIVKRRKKTISRKKNNDRINRIIRNIKKNRFSFSLKKINIPKINIDFSGIKLPKGLTWGQVGAWTIAAGSLIVAAVK